MIAASCSMYCCMAHDTSGNTGREQLVITQVLRYRPDSVSKNNVHCSTKRRTKIKPSWIRSPKQYKVYAEEDVYDDI